MVKQAELSDLYDIAELAFELWPEHTIDELKDEMEEYISKKGCVIFLNWDGDIPNGFAQCSLRTDYVEGTETSPVGYLEGIFVREEHRNEGIGTELLEACEKWARNLGCTEFASDCELSNDDGFSFHVRSGFSAVNRIICFTKQL